MRKLLLLCMVTFTTLFISCSGSDEDNSPAGATSVTVTSDFTSREVDQTVTFTATNNLGENVTASSTFFVNNVQITGNTYTTSTAGVYAVKTTNGSLNSAAINVTFTALAIPLTSITVTTNPATSVDKGSVVAFIATGNNGANLTSTSTFFVNGTQITGSTYQTTVAGTLDVYATHTTSTPETFTAPTVQVVVNDITNFNKRVLIEDFTGTWCGYCPRVAQAIDLVDAQTTDAVVVAIHRGNDPYNFAGSAALETQINLTGYPTAMLNRTTTWAYPEPNWVSQAVNLTTGTNPRLGLAMNTSVAGNAATVEVKVKFGKDFSNLKLVVYAVEDNLIHDQTNYTTYFGGGSTISAFEHDNVLRGVVSSDILGEAITGSTLNNTEYTKTFNYTIPGAVNTANVRFVAFVIDSTNKAVNSRAAGANENQAYEIE
jgi:thiol-disulfide isomerase/thioredoxin